MKPKKFKKNIFSTHVFYTLNEWLDSLVGNSRCHPVQVSWVWPFAHPLVGGDCHDTTISVPNRLRQNKTEPITNDETETNHVHDYCDNIQTLSVVSMLLQLTARIWKERPRSRNQPPPTRRPQIRTSGTFSHHLRLLSSCCSS